MELEKLIRDVPDFPVKGIIFKDITTLIKDAGGFAEALDRFYEMARDKGVTKVAGIEARGFIFGGALAAKLGVGFIPVRKKGKLPAEKISETYDLEYGTDTIEVHKDAFTKGDKVLLHDDLLATGGTMEAACNLIEKTGAEIVQISFLIDLTFLKGKDKLKGYDVRSLIEY